jgi:phosphate transport system substrate-binding protein
MQPFVLSATGVLVLGMGMTAVGQPRPAGEPQLAAYRPIDQLVGRASIVGSETMRPLLIRLAAEFRRRYPEVKIGIEGGGSSPAVLEFVQSLPHTRRGDGDVTGHEGSTETLILSSSRELSASEMEEFTARHHYPPTPIPIAVDAVALYVHKENPLAGLTLEEVDGMFSRTRLRGSPKRIDRWGQVGLPDEWRDAPIRLYGRDRTSGTRTFFHEHVLEHGEFATSVQEQPGLASLMLAVGQDRFGIGYGGIGFLASTVRPVPLAQRAGDAFVAPSMSAVADGSYPLRRFLYLYVNKASRSVLPPVVREFLLFANSREGQETVLKVGFYPISAKQATDNLEALLN